MKIDIKKVNIVLGILIISGLAYIALQTYEIGPFAKEENSSIETPIEDDDPEKVSRKSDYQSYLKKGNQYLEASLYELAINEFTKANKEDTSKADPFTKIGSAHLELKNIGKARKNFETALELEPTKLEARLGLGKSFIAERDIEEAKKVFEPLHDKNTELSYYKGLIFAYLKDYEKSKEALIAGKALESDEEEIKEKIQILLDAYAEFQRNKGGVEVHLQTLIAKAFTEVGEHQMAIPLLFEVIKEKANYTDAWTIMGYAYLQTGEIQDAIDALEEAKKLSPGDPENLFFLGLSYFNNEEFDNAIENLELALQNGYEPAVLVKQKLAEVYVLQKEFDKAAETYEELISLNDNNIYTFIRPTWLYIDKLDAPEKALDLSLIALETHPEHAMAYNLVGWSYLANENLGKAKRHLIEAIKIDGQMDAAYLNLGSVYEKKDDPKIALKLYKKAQAIQRDPAITNLAQRKYHKLRIKEEQKLYQANLTQQ